MNRINGIKISTVKNQILFLLLILFILHKQTAATPTDSVNKKHVYFSKEQKFDEKQWNNFIHYPVIKITDSELHQVLKPFLIYPEVAKKYHLNRKSFFEFELDTSGVIAKIISDSSRYPLFDTVTIKAIKATNGYWESALDRKKKVNMNIHIPVFYYSKNNGDQIYYYISFFYNYKPFLVDSSNTFPAQVKITNEDENDLFNHTYEFDLLHSLNIEHHYGRIEIGVEVDTSGKADNYQITTSYTPPIDSIALNQLKEKKWIPARKHGQLVPSYITVNVYFEKLQTSFRGVKQINYYLGFYPTTHRPFYDYSKAKKLFNQGDYKNASELFAQCANWYYYDPEVFYNKAVNEFKLEELNKACSDLQACADLCEQRGYPVSVTKEMIDNLLQQFCQ